MTLELVTAFTNLEALKTPTIPYVFSDHKPEDTAQLCKDMVEALYKYDGLGISANQLGLPWSIFAIRSEEPEKAVIFNPHIAMPGEEIVKLEEACLSFPRLVVPIKRAKVIRVRFASATGETDSHTFTGMTARVFAHEMDHLAGRMFFEGCSRFHLERAIRQAKNKGYDYSAMGLMKYAKGDK